jgi:hypothetical protein
MPLSHSVTRSNAHSPAGQLLYYWTSNINLTKIYFVHNSRLRWLSSRHCITSAWKFGRFTECVEIYDYFIKAVSQLASVPIKLIALFHLVTQRLIQNHKPSLLSIIKSYVMQGVLKFRNIATLVSSRWIHARHPSLSVSEKLSSAHFCRSVRLHRKPN